MTTATTDRELIMLISNGNKDAFEMLYKRHWADLYKFAFLILRDKDACKDIIQDIFVWLWERRLQLEIESPKAYLKGAVKFKIANLIRSGKIRDSFYEATATFNGATSVAISAETAELKELNTIIQQTVAELPPKCMEIFKLSREANLSNREIAEQLHISVKTVENQLTIALQRIRKNAAPHLISVLLLPVINHL